MVVPNVDTRILRPIEECEPLPVGVAERASQLRDAMQSATGRCNESGEVTSSGAFLDGDVLRAVNERTLTPEMLDKLQQCFDKIRKTPTGLPDGRVLAKDEISGRQVNWWLRTVNRELGRGTEFRRARK